MDPPITTSAPTATSNTAAQTTTSATDRSCQMCPEIDNLEMVMCDACSLWHHYTCVGVNSEIESSNVPWFCPKCAPSRCSSSKANSKASSRRRKSERQLAMLEEERALQAQLFEERAKFNAEYLKKKADILQELSSDEDVVSVVPDVRDRTASWVSMQSNTGSSTKTQHENENDIQERVRELHIDGQRGLGSQAAGSMQHQATNQPTSSSAAAKPAGNVHFERKDHAESTVNETANEPEIVQRTNPQLRNGYPNINDGNGFFSHNNTVCVGMCISDPNANCLISQYYSPPINQQRNRSHSAPHQFFSANQLPNDQSAFVPPHFSTHVVHQLSAPLANASLAAPQPSQYANSGPRHQSTLTSQHLRQNQQQNVPASQPFINPHVPNASIPPMHGGQFTSVPPFDSTQYAFPGPSLAQRFPVPNVSGISMPGHANFSFVQQPNQLGASYMHAPNCAAPHQMPHAVGAHFGQNFGEPLLTNRHFASRHTTPKELPLFHGKPEEWPLFISTFERSTNACGFSQEENLVRLQKCLKGKALEAVSSRLILPSGVPQILATLRQLFGRPEQIVHSLLLKVRSEPAPKMEKLETIVTYSLAIQNLCATMEVCGLTSHLSNPLLLQELIDKLPPQLKLSWATQQQTLQYVNLMPFSNWLSQIAAAASSISLSPADSRSTKNHVNAHSNEKPQSTMESSSLKGRCPICSDDHKVAECSQFIKLEVSHRWNLVKEKKLCRRCLGRHSITRCKSKNVCGENGCQFKHNPLLHSNATKTADSEQKNATTNCNTHQQSKQSVLFRIVPVMLHGKSKSISTFAFLDEGSSLTLLEDSIADELQLNGTTESLCLRWTSDQTRVEPDSKSVSLEISARDNTHRYKLKNVRTVKNLSLPEQSMSAVNLTSKFSHLRGIPLHTYTKATPRILIGIDHAKLGLPIHIKEGKWTEPIATETRLGWTVHGCLSHTQQPSCAPIVHHSFHACECRVDETLHRLVKDFFEADSSGVTGTPAMESDDEIRAKSIMERTTIRSGDRYETGLLWRYDNITLPDSYLMAKRRLTCLEKKMSQDVMLSANLHQQMADYLRKGYARKLTPDELLIPNSRAWYLPIFAVSNHNKPGKIRLVWDAAAKVEGISLNTVLLKGPDQLVSLPKVLFGFREKKVAICGDIREMFHQVRIKSEDQQSQRFLWRDNTHKEPSVYVMEVMTFGASCSPSSAQFVKNRNALEHVEQFPRAVKAIVERHYVDDWLDSVDTVEEAIKLAEDVKLIHSKGGFEIRNWVSNSPKVLEALGQSPKTVSTNIKICEDASAEKVLGMWWCQSNDSFTFKLNSAKLDSAIVNGDRKPTKREVLRTLMSIFDPLGLLVHFLVYVKILLQEIWRSATGWDEPLSDVQNSKWRVWAQQLAMVEQVRVNRCYCNLPPNTWKSIQLHTFVDASENAYAAVCYFRISDGERVECSLIAAKTKVSPLKPMSIPRLELQAATLGARLAKNICDSHSIKIDRRIFWSDSRTVLSWLNSDQRRYKQFVALRVGEILEISEIDEWHWISTKLNVADEATKWNKTPGFEENSRWFCGPEFLHQSEDLWPKQPTEITSNAGIEEFRPNVVLATNIVELPCTPDPIRFSQWQRLYHAQACLFRCVNTFISKVRRISLQVGPFSTAELQLAENQLFRRAQIEIYAVEIAILRNQSSSKSISKSSPLFKLSPYLDESSILRIRGRIDAASRVATSMKRPIILPSKHHITRLVVNHFHIEFHHQNNETVINELRQRYAIPRVRQVLKSVKRECQKCKIMRALPYLKWHRYRPNDWRPSLDHLRTWV